MWGILRHLFTHTEDIPKQTEAEKYYSDAKDARYTFLLVIAVCLVRYCYYAWFVDEKLSLADGTFVWLLVIGAYVRAKFYEVQASQAAITAGIEVLLLKAEREIEAPAK